MFCFIIQLTYVVFVYVNLALINPWKKKWLLEWTLGMLSETLNWDLDIYAVYKNVWQETVLDRVLSVMHKHKSSHNIQNFKIFRPISVKTHLQNVDKNKDIKYILYIVYCILYILHDVPGVEGSAGVGYFSTINV